MKDYHTFWFGAVSVRLAGVGVEAASLIVIAAAGWFVAAEGTAV